MSDDLTELRLKCLAYLEEPTSVMNVADLVRFVSGRNMFSDELLDSLPLHHRPRLYTALPIICPFHAKVVLERRLQCEQDNIVRRVIEVVLNGPSKEVTP